MALDRDGRCAGGDRVGDVRDVLAGTHRYAWDCRCPSGRVAGVGNGCPVRGTGRRMLLDVRADVPLVDRSSAVDCALRRADCVPVLIPLSLDEPGYVRFMFREGVFAGHLFLRMGCRIDQMFGENESLSSDREETCRGLGCIWRKCTLGIYFRRVGTPILV